MKRSKRIYLLLGILAAACIATFAVLRFEERKERIKNSDEVILEVPANSVKSLSWSLGSQTLAFHKDETWLYDEDEAFPVDEDKINALLSPFEAFGVSFIIEEVEDYAQYGLDDPVCTIRFATEAQSYEVALGNYSKMDAQRYVSIGDGNVYLVKRDPLEDFDAGLSDLIRHDEIPSFDRATEIRFSGAETSQIFYSEDSPGTYRDDDVYFVRQGDASLPLDSTRVKRYLSGLASLNLTNYVTYSASEEELRSYGLDDPELTITVTYAAEDESGESRSDAFMLHVSRPPEERAAVETGGGPEASEDDEITAYARLGQSQIVYRITSDNYKALMAASYDDLRHPEVLPADIADVNQIVITLEGTDYTLTSKEDGGSRVWYYLEEELDLSNIQAALEALRADSFTEEPPAGKEEIALRVYLEREGDPVIELGLYRYDGANCLAVVDGQPVSLVQRSLVVALIEAFNAIVLNEQ